MADDPTIVDAGPVRRSGRRTLFTVEGPSQRRCGERPQIRRSDHPGASPVEPYENRWRDDVGERLVIVMADDLTTSPFPNRLLDHWRGDLATQR
jgi:hypothetical protein